MVGRRGAAGAFAAYVCAEYAGYRQYSARARDLESAERRRLPDHYARQQFSTWFSEEALKETQPGRMVSQVTCWDAAETSEEFSAL